MGEKRGRKRRATFQTAVCIFRFVTLQIVLAEKSSSLHVWSPRWDYVNDKLMNVKQKQERKKRYSALAGVLSELSVVPCTKRLLV